MPEAVIAGQLTSWRQWDRGGARPVLALHCTLAHAGAWSGLAETLQGITLTAPDLPGHGRSAAWDGREDIHSLATRVAAAIAETMAAGAPIDLIGHSFGGTVALRIALERPDLVRSLTLVEPVIFAAARAAESPAWAPFRAAHRVFADLIAQGALAEAAARFHAQWGTGAAFADLPGRQQGYMLQRIALVAAQDAVLLEDAAGLLRFMGLESLGVPVLLIEGADSPPIIGAVQGELARRLPMARRVIVPGAGHMAPITHAACLAPAVQAHLDGC